MLKKAVERLLDATRADGENAIGYIRNAVRVQYKRGKDDSPSVRLVLDSFAKRVRPADRLVLENTEGLLDLVDARNAASVSKQINSLRTAKNHFQTALGSDNSAQTRGDRECLLNLATALIRLANVSDADSKESLTEALRVASTALEKTTEPETRQELLEVLGLAEEDLDLRVFKGVDHYRKALEHYKNSYKELEASKKKENKNELLKEERDAECELDLGRIFFRLYERKPDCAISAQGQ